MKKGDLFYYQAQKLFDEKVLTEIYTTNNISLCNVGNAYYVAFLLGDIYAGKEIEFMVLTDEQIEQVMQNEENLVQIYENRPKNEKMVYVFNERACNTMINSKNRTLKEGPKVDLEKEASLIEKYVNNGKVL